MLFEYMLNDPVLPAVAKALISHLHTPYLKVAIIDRRLLTDSNHDARQLLDSLVEAGSHWIDERNLKRGIYRITSYNVCYTKLLRSNRYFKSWVCFSRYRSNRVFSTFSASMSNCNYGAKS